MDASKCVTGATGFIAGHLTEQLMTAGYSVRGTVRDIQSADAGALRRQLHGDERLELVHADLLEPGSFDRAVDGCDTVFHVASPFVLTVADPARDLVAPAVAGTLNILRACLSSPTTTRVVLTSSIAALVGMPDGGVITESEWNTHSGVDSNPYYYAKTEAERAAWRFMDEHHPQFDLVVINPGQVLGPSHRTTVGTSVANIRDLMTGAIPAITDLDVPYVDVRDVADAHIRASEIAAAHGRYLCVAGVITTRQLVETIKSLGYDGYSFPRLPLDSPTGTRIARIVIKTQPRGLRQYLQAFIGRRLVIDTTRIRNELHVEFRPLEDTIRDTIQDLAAKRHIPPTP